MSASSPHGFVVVRGRGYRPEQVDARVSGLNAEREAAWDRTAQLTRLAEETAEEAQRLHDVAAALPPQTYEALGPRAQGLLGTAEAEAADLRAAAEAEAHELTERAEEEARSLQDGAKEAAARRRADAEAAAARTVDAAQDHADELRAHARDHADKTGREAAEALREMSRRCSALLAEQEKEQAAESDAADREIAQNEAAFAAHAADLEERGARALADARRQHAQAEEWARHRHEDAVAQGEELLAQARVREEGIARETERVLREHTERADELRQHMAHVRSSLAALTGRAPEAAPDTATVPPQSAPASQD
ncbi:cellulose-binding protein [Streptomyces sp. PU-14G]|uniref:cellulose-binding protein n=1 Tax=Streptomyces sp. PU-14G TaxID=2800808 RepID=UPI0034DF54B0